MILVTGGAGYIGSHFCALLAQSNQAFVIYDNFSNSSSTVLARLKELTGKTPLFVEGDIRSDQALGETFNRYPITAVVHFAALKSIVASVQNPLTYYNHNVEGTMTLIRAMQTANIKRLIFSSTAAVYGTPERMPVTEDMVACPANPYGRSKKMVEDILKDLAQTAPDWRITVLRYFNAVGAHESGLLGDEGLDISSCLMPKLGQVALGQLPNLAVFGNTYATPDGTGVRDYIHVMDLAEGHCAALRRLNHQIGFDVFNLGTGQGHSVLEMIRFFSEASGLNIPYQIIEQRAGDIPISYAAVDRAKSILGWQAQRDIQTICKDHWRWLRTHSVGYIN